VVRVLTDAELAKSLSERAASKVRAEFGWDKVASVFTEACERAAAQSARGRAALDEAGLGGRVAGVARPEG